FFDGFDLRRRRFDVAPDAAEQVELPARVEPCFEDVLHGRVEDLAEGERALAARRCGSGSDLRQAPRGGESARGPGFGDARGGDLDVEVLLHGALDQTVEQRILERCPPARYVFRAAAGALAESRGDLHVRP